MSSNLANIEIAQQAWSALMARADASHFGTILDKALRALAGQPLAAPAERRTMSDEDLVSCLARIEAGFGRMSRIAQQDPTSPIIATIAAEMLHDIQDLG